MMRHERNKVKYLKALDRARAECDAHTWWGAQRQNENRFSLHLDGTIEGKEACRAQRLRSQFALPLVSRILLGGVTAVNRGLRRRALGRLLLLAAGRGFATWCLLALGRFRLLSTC
jgi:hypothetical protein